MKKILLLVLCFSFVAAAKTYSAEIAWMYVQHREYGAGKSVNRLSFGLVDEQLNYLTSDASVAEVKLYNPGGQEVVLLSKPNCISMVPMPVSLNRPSEIKFIGVRFTIRSKSNSFKGLLVSYKCPFS